jgi:hypothetical protein
MAYHDSRDGQSHTLSRLADPMVDFVLFFAGEPDESETYDGAWERVNAVRVLSDSYAMRPTEFLTYVPNAFDWLLRITTTPELYRERTQASLDRAHPDVVLPKVAQFERRVHAALGIRAGHGSLGLLPRVPSLHEYWRWRAHRLHQVEARILEIWPPAVNES